MLFQSYKQLAKKNMRNNYIYLFRKFQNMRASP